MTKREPKPKIQVSTRAPRAKGDMFNNLRKPEEIESISVEELVAPPSSAMGTQSTQSTASTQSARVTPAAPVRDFQKVANSITRIAVPAGVFKGKCKQLYDFLYSKTRGAITPSRTVRLTRREIMRGSDIGSTKTLFLNLRHLRDAGLVTWDERVGPHEGNVYMVHLPEEIATAGTQSTQSTDSASSPKVDRVLGVESTPSTHSQSVDFTEASGITKTSIKTKTNDDDETVVLSDLVSIFAEANQKLTGRKPRASEREHWAELARTLVEELNDAAARAEGVSSVPAFLNAHLRRKLAPKPVARKREGNQKADVGLPPASPSDPDARLTPEEIESFTSTVVDLLGEGKSVEEVEACYAPSMHPADWATVKNVALAQGTTKKGK